MNSNTLVHNRVIAPIFIGLSILIAVFFLRPVYATYVENVGTLATLEKEQSSLVQEYQILSDIKNSNTSNQVSPERLDRIKKLSKTYDTSDIMAIVLLNDFTRDSVGESAPIAIGSISVNKGRKLPNGLSLGEVSMSLQGKSVDDIIDYITFLTQSSPYLFTLDNITLPIDTAPEDGEVGAYSLGLNLGVYYYE